MIENFEKVIMYFTFDPLIDGGGFLTTSNKHPRRYLTTLESKRIT